MQNQPDENPAEEIRQVLEENGVHTGIFFSFSDLKNSFSTSFRNYLEHIARHDIPYIPKRCNLLRFLMGCDPTHTKVIIVGHDPIEDEILATGVAFSFPKGNIIDRNIGERRAMLSGKGRSVAILHDALNDAGFLERGGHYDCCHEEWMERGVLMLNASLTWMYGKDHFPIWRGFIEEILYKIADVSTQKPVFFLFWGTGAKPIGYWLSSKLSGLNYSTQIIDQDDHSTAINRSARIVIFIGDHPTYPRLNSKFRIQAANQFRHIKKHYPELFALPNLRREE